MSIENLRNQFAEYAKDIKLNLSSILTEEGAPGLAKNQIYSIALASAYATQSTTLIRALEADAASLLSTAEVAAAKAAACLMAMNNVYYRFLHMVNDVEFKKLPAQLRMNFMANPGVSRTDFEAYALAVSAINGCGMCIEAHTHALEKAGLSKLAIQSTVRIAAVISAAAQTLAIDSVGL